MTEATGFMAAIRANPADDTVRLVYADWLQERGGEARAEYIRLYISSRHMTGDELARAGFRLSALYHRVIHPLLDGWATHSGRDGGNSSPHMDRGFIAQIRCTWEAWAAHGDGLLAVEWVPRVVFDTCPEFGGDEDDVWLVGDPAKVRVPWVDVIDHARREKCGPATSVLRLRYGTSIAFEMPEFEGWNGADPRTDLLAGLQQLNDLIAAAGHQNHQP
jgi:uncharacterized protein (TIGR02996 family)